MNREQLEKLSPEKLRILLEFSEKGKNMNSNELMALLFSTYQSMQRQGIQFTPEESTLLIEILKNDISPEERQKIEMFQSMMGR